MRLTLYASVNLIRRFLAVHSLLGVYLGAVIYVICFTGTLLVFIHELERWEQPIVDEFHTFPPASIQTAVDQFITRVDKVPETIYVVPPTNTVPRAHVGAGEHEWFTNAGGELTQPPIEAWVHMVRDLHYYLHLPESFGMIVVSIFGVILTALIISGILCHPTIIKDAFNFRLFAITRVAQTDIHNRLSVWGLPFHIMIAATGSFIGLFSIFVAVAAPTYFDGDRTRVIETIYGSDPVLDTAVEPINIEQALEDLNLRAPEAMPIYYAFQKLGTRQQFLEIAAQLPQRLTYSEIYRYDYQGQYINHQGLADGPVGRQGLYSVYRLHFGQFGGFGIKLLYLCFGLALTVVSATGMNIWLAKKYGETLLHRGWQGVVWGLPAALGVSACWTLVFPINMQLVFWLAYIIGIMIAFFSVSVQQAAGMLKALLALSLWGLLAMHLHKYPLQKDNVVVLTVNLFLVAAGLFFIFQLVRRDRFDFFKFLKKSN